jgi:hypothetical protein
MLKGLSPMFAEVGDSALSSLYKVKALEKMLKGLSPMFAEVGDRPFKI